MLTGENEYKYKVDGYQYAEKLLEGFKFEVIVRGTAAKFEVEVTSKTTIPGIDMAYWYEEICEGEFQTLMDMGARGGQNLFSEVLTEAQEGLEV